MVDLTSPRANVGSQQKAKLKTRSDAGTILLHWLTALSMVASLLTGLRISSDGLPSELGTGLARILDPVLPQGELWTWHILASLVLFFCTTAYWVYLRRAALGERNAAARLRTLSAPTTTRLRWRAINVALHWIAYGAIAALSVTGSILYLGYGGLAISLHRALAWAMLSYIFIHTIAHFIYGGLDQILRLFRPSALVENLSAKSWPLGIAIFAGIGTTVAIAMIDRAARPVLNTGLVNAPPVLDGKINESVWQKAKPVFMPTQQGANLGGSGSSTVEVRAIRTEKEIHFAFRWEDPTRSLMRSPTIKRADGWYVMSTKNAKADVIDYYEDKFAVLFSHNDGFGGGESTFLGKDPLKTYPKSPHGRGLHYTSDGRVMDMWQWKSSRGGMLGHVDDMHFGPPKKPDAKQQAGKKRYAAGYDADPGKAIYEYNYIADGPKGYGSPVRLKRLPKDWKSVVAGLGNIPTGADRQNTQNSRWWMTVTNAVPYSPELDAEIPVGTILPATLNIHEYQGDRADLSGGARWADGYWTLEVSRKLHTGSPYDISFQPGTRLYLWVSVFDHNQIRHTRHQRAITLHIQ